MKTWSIFLGVAAAAWVLSTTRITEAAVVVPLVNVDFGSASSPTQSGFQAMSATPTTFSTPVGQVTVDTIASGDKGFFDRTAPGNSGAFTYSDLYRDFFYHNGGTLSVNISGLPASNVYELKLYSYDIDNVTDSGTAHTETFTPTSGTVGAPGLVNYSVGVSPASNDAASVVVSWLSNSSGQIVFTVSGNQNYSRINGFELSIAPEPTAMTFLLVAAFGGLCARRRRRRHHQH